MKHIITAVTVTSVITLVGCNKTEKVTTNSSTQTIEEQLEVDVEVDGGEIRVMINGKEQVIELDEIMKGINLEDIDGEMSIAVMAVTDEEGSDPTHVMQWVSGEPEIEMHMMGEHGGPPESMRKHMMKMMGEHGDPPAGMGEHGSPPESMRKHMIKMMGEHGGPPAGMGEHGTQPMDMKKMHECMTMDGGECHGEWRGHADQLENTELREFIEELISFTEVAMHLELDNAVSMMGIHMIHDELEGELRMEALGAIIEGSDQGTPERNAAIIVAIQTMLEADNLDAAAEYMVDLVLSN